MLMGSVLVTGPAPACRTLKAHPNRWQVHVVNRTGGSDCIATRDEQPSYQEVEALLRDRPESMMNKVAGIGMRLGMAVGWVGEVQVLAVRLGWASGAPR